VPTPHLDSAVLASLQDMLADEYPVLLDTFLADSEERMRLLAAAVRGQDVRLLRLTAHSFKGSCSNMGALPLADLCKQLEDTRQPPSFEAAAVLVERIAAEFALVGMLLRAERQGFRG
jgi:HPt (histidine-containing phosphotransfer) domain-containing protein